MDDLEDERQYGFSWGLGKAILLCDGVFGMALQEKEVSTLLPKLSYSTTEALIRHIYISIYLSIANLRRVCEAEHMMLLNLFLSSFISHLALLLVF